MKWFAGLVLTLALLVGCGTVAPTPVLMGSLVKQNNEVVALYAACSEGANYVPSKEGCDPDLLATKVDSTMVFAKIFISGDIKQPPGYDVYLATAMIYFRIAQRVEDEYSEAERIARQFFEIQKASSGRSLPPARFYWAAMASGHASWQWYNDRLALDADRKTELLECLAQGRVGLTNTTWLDGPRRVRLVSYIQVLTLITNKIEG
jgi:hypothetical protein